MKNEIIIKANMTNVPAEMVKASENLQKILNNVNATKKQLAKASYELKVQADESKVTFKAFIENHFSMFDISASRIYALAQTAEMFDTDEYRNLWDRIPVSKLEKMSRIKKAKSNKNVGAFNCIAFLQCVSFRGIESHNFGVEKSSQIVQSLKERMQEAIENMDFATAQKCKNDIEKVGNAQIITVPEDVEEQKAFYLNDGISRICAMTDVKIGELVKLYNLYSDIVKPETDGNNDSKDSDNKDSDNKGSDNSKTIPEMIASILTEVQNLRDKAKADNIELPDSTIQAFIECMENFGK